MDQEDKIDSIDEVLDEIINLDKHKNQNLLMISSMLNLDNKIKGCSHEEILKIEEFYKINLPYSYKKFLSRMGHNAGNFLSGTDAFYNNIFDIRTWADELLYECNNPFVLEDYHFVFAIHQGYQFCFFSTDNNNLDPSIYYYYEGEDNFYKKYNNYLDFLLDSLSYIKDKKL